MLAPELPQVEGAAYMREKCWHHFSGWRATVAFLSSALVAQLD